MGISVCSQGLTHVVDELFADVKGAFVFNYLDDLVVYSRSVEEHAQHVLRTVLLRLGDAGLTLNPTKMTIGTRDVTYLGHCLSSRGISVFPDSDSHPGISSAYQFEIPEKIY